MANPLIPKKDNSNKFVDLPHSAGILDDYAVRKNVATREGTIEKVPVSDNDIANKAYVDSKLGGDITADTITLNNPNSEFYNPAVGVNTHISAGTFHIIDTATFPVILYQGNPANTTIQTVNVSGYLPASAKAVLLLVNIDEDGGVTRQLNLYMDAAGTILLNRVLNYSGNAEWRQYIHPFSVNSETGIPNQNIYWNVSNADVDNVYIQLIGYWC